MRAWVAMASMHACIPGHQPMCRQLAPDRFLAHPVDHDSLDLRLELVQLSFRFLVRPQESVHQLHRAVQPIVDGYVLGTGLQPGAQRILWQVQGHEAHKTL